MPTQPQTSKWHQSKWAQHALTVLALLILFLGVRPYMQGPVATGQAPDINRISLNKTAVQLSKFQGQPVMVHFWATWCPICQAQHGAVNAAAQYYPVISIATQTPADTNLADFAQQHQMDVNNLIDDSDGSLFQAYGAKAVPATFFIDKHGNIATVEVGYTTQLGMMLRLWWLE